MHPGAAIDLIYQSYGKLDVEVDVDLEKRLVDQRCYRTPGEYV